VQARRRAAAAAEATAGELGTEPRELVRDHRVALQQLPPERRLLGDLLARACIETRAHCHSSLPFIAPMGILNIYENG
jgi:hypothetical protein